MKNIVIIGSGGFAKEVAFLIDEINAISPQWNLLGYIDNGEATTNGKYQVINNDTWLQQTDAKIHVAFGIGNPLLLKKIHNTLKHNKNITFPNLIHPNVIGDWERITFGQGNIICASCTFTTDISIGNFNIINLDSTIGHDVAIGNYNVINPSVNISGGVQIKNKNMIGTNSTILQYIELESDLIIGASALILKNINEPGIYVGSPVKKIK